jgi:hypothetical protein
MMCTGRRSLLFLSAPLLIRMAFILFEVGLDDKPNRADQAQLNRPIHWGKI